MIVFFTTARFRRTLKGLVKSRHRAAPVRIHSYDWLFRQSSIKAAACIFTDFDRLRHFELATAAEMFRQMREAGIRVLNDPARACHREELLYRLHEAGINKFRAYRAVLDPKPTRFPVFLKCVSGHAQHLDVLINSQDELDARMLQLRAEGFPLAHMLVIEFANRLHRENVWRRHTIYRIGDRMVPANPVTEANPFVKHGTAGLASKEDLANSVKEIRENPYAPLMRRVFDIAGIEYGRADFGFDGEAPAVYEINTNPTIGFRVVGGEGAHLDAINHYMGLIAKAVDALDGEDRVARLVHEKSYRRRLEFSFSLRLKQP